MDTALGDVVDDAHARVRGHGRRRPPRSGVRAARHTGASRLAVVDLCPGPPHGHPVATQWPQARRRPALRDHRRVVSALTARRRARLVTGPPRTDTRRRMARAKRGVSPIPLRCRYAFHGGPIAVDTHTSHRRRRCRHAGRRHRSIDCLAQRALHTCGLACGGPPRPRPARAMAGKGKAAQLRCLRP